MQKTFLWIFLFFVSACGTTRAQWNTSPRIVGAEASLKLGTGDNGNTALAIRVKHLAPPEKLNGAAKTYVVWVKPKEGPNPQAQNVGALKVDNDLEGSLETVTPFKKFDLFVTPEPSATATQPSNENALWTTVTAG